MNWVNYFLNKNNTVISIPRKFIWKIMIAGQGGVGKTTLIQRYLTNIFTPDTKLTIGVQFHAAQLDRNGKDVTLALWDLGGQEHFRVAQGQYTKGSHAAIIFFDTSRLDTSFYVEKWADLIRKYAGPDVPLFLGGTKIDLLQDDQIEGIHETAKDLVKENDMVSYKLTSSKTGENVKEIFYEMADMMIEKAEQKLTGQGN